MTYTRTYSRIISKKHDYTLFRRKDSKIWYFYYYDGNKRISKSTGKLKKYDAEIFSKAFLDKDGSENITLFDYTKDFFVWTKCKWIKRQHAKGRNFSEIVAKNRRGILNNYILPKYGFKFIADLNRINIEDWLISLKLAGSTKNQILYTFRTVLKNAEFQNVIKTNPLDKIERMATNSKTRDVFTLQELKILFPEDKIKLYHIWKNLKYAACFFVLATTGIRTGEIRAIHWKDILWDHGGLIIDKAAKHDGSIGSTKTNKSRVVLLPSKTIDILNKWRKESPFNQEDDLIFFGSEREKVISQSYLSMYFKPCLNRAGIQVNNRILVVHSFRHGFNTMMRQVLPEQIFRELTGHKSEKMTDLYDHPSLDEKIKRLGASRKLIEGVWEEKT